MKRTTRNGLSGIDPSNHTNPTKILALRPSQRPLKTPLSEPQPDPQSIDPSNRKALSVQLSPLMVDVETAAVLLSIGRTALFDEIRVGRIRTVKRGKSRLIPVKALNEYVDLLLTETEQEAA